MNGSFTLNLSRFVAKTNANIETLIKKVVLDVGSAVVMRTPVGDPDTWASPAPAGYVGGRARASWCYGHGAPAGEDPGGVDDSGAASIERIKAGVEADSPFARHYITSTVPYMARLEYEGWSRQAPAGMVGITIEEYQQYIDNATRTLT